MCALPRAQGARLEGPALGAQGMALPPWKSCWLCLWICTPKSLLAPSLPWVVPSFSLPPPTPPDHLGQRPAGAPARELWAGGWGGDRRISGHDLVRASAALGRNQTAEVIAQRVLLWCGMRATDDLRLWEIQFVFRNITLVRIQRMGTLGGSELVTGVAQLIAEALN